MGFQESEESGLSREKILKNMDSWVTSKDLVNSLGCDYSNLTSLLSYYRKSGYIKRNKLKGNKYEYKITKKGKSLLYSNKEYKKSKTELIRELREQESKVDRFKEKLEDNKSLDGEDKRRFKEAYSGGRRGEEPLFVSRDFNLSDIANSSLNKEQLAILGLTPVVNDRGQVYTIKRSVNRDERVLSEEEVLQHDFRIDVSMSHSQKGNSRVGDSNSSKTSGREKYFCPKCQRNHYTDSKIGRKHLDYLYY